MKLGVRIVLECSRFRLNPGFCQEAHERQSRAAIDTRVPTWTPFELFARPANWHSPPVFMGRVNQMPIVRDVLGDPSIRYGTRIFSMIRGLSEAERKRAV